MSRLEDNRKILERLSAYIEAHQDYRFIQALWGIGLINTTSHGVISENNINIPMIEDRFYEEPQVTLEKLTD